MGDRNRVPLQLVDHADGWYSIEKAEHECKGGIVWNRSGGSFHWSGRISDADVEGTAEHMIGIAEAIIARGFYSAKRCCVEVSKDGATAAFSSPRNSRRDGVVPYADALALANEIMETLASPAPEGGGS